MQCFRTLLLLQSAVPAVWDGERGWEGDGSMLSWSACGMEPSHDTDHETISHREREIVEEKLPNPVLLEEGSLCVYVHLEFLS